jgi:hypothetical protein
MQVRSHEEKSGTIRVFPAGHGVTILKTIMKELRWFVVNNLYDSGNYLELQLMAGTRT